MATSVKVAHGESWSYHCYVENFPTWNEALKFEWAWKFQSRQRQKKKGYERERPLERRLAALNVLLGLERPTSKALTYKEWPITPNVVYI